MAFVRLDVLGGDHKARMNTTVVPSLKSCFDVCICTFGDGIAGSSALLSFVSSASDTFLFILGHNSVARCPPCRGKSAV